MLREETGSEIIDKAEPSGRKVARIVFNVPGNDIGSQESQKIVEEIKATLLTNEVGDIVSFGHGIGTMEVVLALTSDKSTDEVRGLIREIYPNGKYRIANNEMTKTA